MHIPHQSSTYMSQSIESCTFRIRTRQTTTYMYYLHQNRTCMLQSIEYIPRVICMLQSSRIAHSALEQYIYVVVVYIPNQNRTCMLQSIEYIPRVMLYVVVIAYRTFSTELNAYGTFSTELTFWAMYTYSLTFRLYLDSIKSCCMLQSLCIVHSAVSYVAMCCSVLCIVHSALSPLDSISTLYVVVIVYSAFSSELCSNVLQCVVYSTFSSISTRLYLDVVCCSHCVQCIQQ